jgi:amino acid adenylation domain-containing protein
VKAAALGRSPLDRFVEAATAAGGAPAVSDERETISYRELTRTAATVAAAVARSEPPGAAVVVCTERSVGFVAAILGIAGAGCAYVPVDPAEPRARTEHILEASGAALAVVDRTGRETLGGSGIRLLDLDSARAGPGAPFPARVGGGAYTLFTSGSSGRPKGVAVTAANLASFLDGARAWAAFAPDEVWSCFHAFTFDVAGWEIWGSLVSRGHLVILPRAAQLDPELLRAEVERRGVARLCQTPTALKQLATAIETHGRPASLRRLYVAGERLDFEVLAPLAGDVEASALEATNVYGPTETTIYATGHRISALEIRRERRSLVGRALPHVRVTVADPDGTPCAPGATGEIRIGGEGVAAGYVGAEASEDAAFVETAGMRWFRTGDRGRLDEDGVLEFLGRSGGFVKIRGYRVEPREVAHALRRHPDVVDAVVVDVTGLPGGDALAAGVVLRPGASSSETAIRRFLATALPAYMLPARLRVLDSLPTLPSGKLDLATARERLQERSATSADAS